MLALILPFLIALVIFVIAYKIFHSAVKSLFYTTILMFLIFIVFSICIYQDTADLKKHFVNSSKIVILEKEGDVVAGLTLQNFEQDLISQNSAESYSNDMANNDLKNILGDRFKLFLFNLDLFSSAESVELYGNQLSGEDFILIMDSDNPKATLNNIFSADHPIFTVIFASMDDTTVIKGKIFSHVSGRLISKNPQLLLKAYRNGNIRIYPETITFKLIKYMPYSIVKRVFAEKDGENA